ncbi:MAG: RluA family pseudouridine synthase [Myxococcota bacterium]|nr:RluA family pseudouridine synthase [Myxococcota bacterium]
MSSTIDRVALVVPREASGGRLDRFLARSTSISRSELQRWIAAGRVTVGGVAQGASTRVREGDRVVVDPPQPSSTTARPESDVRFDVLHVDTDLVVVDKPAGLVVHPARGHEGGTLVNGILALGLFSQEELTVGDAQGHSRPGIVHRLDKGTSGVMVVARTAHAREILAAQFRAHSIERAYEAIVVGRIVDRTFDTLHGRHPRDRLRFTTHVRAGKRAVTHVRVIAQLAGATHIECALETGRTHQIRVHLAESGTAVLGDPLYGSLSRDERVRAVALRLGHQALHARVLGFAHPRTGERVRFEVVPPLDFRDALVALRA